MFGGFAPPQLSAEETRQLEDEASWTVKQFLATAVVLYICQSNRACLYTMPSQPVSNRSSQMPPLTNPRFQPHSLSRLYLAFSKRIRDIRHSPQKHTYSCSVIGAPDYKREHASLGIYHHALRMATICL
ncbi:hypothetical protein F5B18DRAFT_625774 [Nemania serpens]|nr:hypothetical protein F5B18DRAFT_625774 [Nemania serpens]